MLKSILEFIIKLLTYKTPKQDQQDTKEEVIVNIPIEIETPKEPIENVPSEVIIDKPTEKVEEVSNIVKLLSVKEYQTYLKKIGLYTKEIDGIIGSGTKKAIYQFNTIFLNVKNDIYTENTDRLLKIIYNAYSKSVYMTDDLWQYFKNFKKTEYKCKCKGKYCNGYPHEISIHIVMADQYARNIYGKSVSITSGLRDIKWNDIQGGTDNSVHPKGQASDSGINEVKASTLRTTYKELAFVYYAYDITSKYVHKSVRL